MDFTNVMLCYEKEAALAGGILCQELLSRIGYTVETGDAPAIRLLLDPLMPEDCFQIVSEENGLRLIAQNNRGLLYAIGLFLRKVVLKNGQLLLQTELSGFYRPHMKIRGHQLGYRAMSNTYDQWDVNEYRRYMIELIFFGINMVEFIPEDKNQNEWMLEPHDRLVQCVKIAKSLGLKVSLWLPNDNLPVNVSAQKRKQILSLVPETDVLFIPGSDPGDYAPRELFERLEAIADAVHTVSDAEIWVSAQAPHDTPDWGDAFIKETEKHPPYLKGVIMGPNHAMPLAQLRSRVPAEYPIRFYPDITHNVRCEYPVHYQKDDWHFSLAAVNGRECINPRPTEYAALHRQTLPYLVGSCSYSEGVNDDVNKMLWSALDFAPQTEVEEILQDYCRLFFPGTDARELCEAILLLEQNWVGDSAENPDIVKALSLLREQEKGCVSLQRNWRFHALLFRAENDLLSAERRKFEQGLLSRAEAEIRNGELKKAEEILLSDFPQDYKAIRNDMFLRAAYLYALIGQQLDIDHFHANAWERGATLESCDLPVTDRRYLLYQLQQTDDVQRMQKIIRRTQVQADEIYYSVALHGLEGLSQKQKNEVYLNFRGDDPNENDGRFPVCLMNIFDSYSLDAIFHGVHGQDGILMLTFTKKTDNPKKHITITVNDHLIYQGNGIGGYTHEAFDDVYGCDGFLTRCYAVAKGIVTDGTFRLSITEDSDGFELCEIRYIKKK